jgi:spore coat protein U-like protein
MPLRADVALTALAVGLASCPAFASCQVSASGMSFGQVSPNGRTDTTGQVRVECDRPQSYELGVATAGNGERHMHGPGGATLRYQMFIDKAHSLPWGDGSSGGSALGNASDGTNADRFTIYGIIPAQPSAPPGDYVDAPLLTLSF